MLFSNDFKSVKLKKNLIGVYETPKQRLNQRELNNMEKRERLDWVDGLRGLACVLMFVHHWMTSFYPSTYNGEMKTSYMPYNLDVKWSAYPISFLTNGNFLLFIFCVVSGLVLSYQIYHMQDVKKIGGGYTEAVSAPDASTFGCVSYCMGYDAGFSVLRTGSV